MPSPWSVPSARWGPSYFPKVTQALIGGYGWEVSLFVTLAIVALTIPLGSLMRGKSDDDGSEAPQNWLQAIGEARKNRGYILLTIGFFVCGFHITFIGIHLPGYVAWCGLSPDVAGNAFLLVGAGNIAGTYLAGHLSNRYRQKNLLSLIYLARAALILWLLLMPKTEMTILIFSGIFGILFSDGAANQRRGRQDFWRAAPGNAFWLRVPQPPDRGLSRFLAGGLSFDVAGDYNAVWYASVALGLMAAVLHWPIRDEPVDRLLTPQTA